MAYTIEKSQPSQHCSAFTLSTVDHHEYRPAEHDGIEIYFDTTRPLVNKVANQDLVLKPGDWMAFNSRVEHVEIHDGSTQFHKTLIFDSNAYPVVSG
jgi:hypothetical protein